MTGLMEACVEYAINLGHIHTHTHTLIWRILQGFRAEMKKKKMSLCFSEIERKQKYETRYHLRSFLYCFIVMLKVQEVILEKDNSLLSLIPRS